MYHPKHVKVFLWPYKHFMHWSHTMASIYMHIAIITCNKSKVIEITLHMLMLMDAQMMLMLMNVGSQCMLNTRVLHALPLGDVGLAASGSFMVGPIGSTVGNCSTTGATGSAPA